MSFPCTESKMEEVFKLFDQKGSGIEIKEIDTVMRSLGIAASEAQLKEFQDTACKQGAGTHVKFVDFVNYAKQAQIVDKSVDVAQEAKQEEGSAAREAPAAGAAPADGKGKGKGKVGAAPPPKAPGAPSKAGPKGKGKAGDLPEEVKEALKGPASPKDSKKTFLVNDFTARRYALDALNAGVPKDLVKKWMEDLSRNFYVTDDSSFESAWWELRHRWEQQQKKKLKKRKSRLPSEDDLEAPAGSGAAPPRKRQARAAAGDSPSEGPERGGSTPSAGGKEGGTGSTASGAGARLRITRQEMLAGEEAARAAHEDVRVGACSSYEQALAVRLTLALGTHAAVALERLAPAGPEPAGAEKATKRLLLLVHPDKTPHPQAKDAFQRLAPLLRRTRPTAGERVGRYHGGAE